ncbi:hypothetical protein AJ80_00383 [Polytolypa hystricis UAMH7299]|uniref:Histone-lysine N-methyltransferase SET5 n=1 Tax=Polytolypa hystricis (strain UAMH7299) TaxID=1447883 RepID=A0A2B7Z3M1_POLH7|nr:hypothetical protein AJ80_00383 [Polytolypa hystricis UAMH7299]
MAAQFPTPAAPGKPAVGPGGTGITPYLPNRPNLFNEVQWGPLPTPSQARRAYKIWKLQDGRLATAAPPDLTQQQQMPEAENITRAKKCLSQNVYDVLMSKAPFPLSKQEWRREAQRGPNGNLRKRDIDEAEPPSSDEVIMVDGKEVIFVNGHDVQESKYWTIAKLKVELRDRVDYIPRDATAAELRQMLYDHEKILAKRRRGCLLPREPIPQWGINRPDDDFMVQGTTPLEVYTLIISLSPFNPAYWTSRAFLYYQMGYLDLAIGDAYRAQLLCEAVENERYQNHQPGLKARVWDAVEQHIVQIPGDEWTRSKEIELLRDERGVCNFTQFVRVTVKHITALCLLGLQSFADFEGMIVDELIVDEMDELHDRYTRLADWAATRQERRLQDDREYYYESGSGYVRGRTYPFTDADEHPRHIIPFVERLNEDFIAGTEAKRGSNLKLCVKIFEDDHLAVFAEDNIAQGETIYVDEPSIRGHLRPRPDHWINRSCENCKRITHPLSQYDRRELMEIEESGEGFGLGYVECPCSSANGDPMYWCQIPRDRKTKGRDDMKLETSLPIEDISSGKPASRKRPRDPEDDGSEDDRSSKRTRTDNGSPSPSPSPPPPASADEEEEEPVRSCLEIAKKLYHFRACGKDWRWLHNTIRPNYNFQGKPYSMEAHGAVLSLLLREVFDITLQRRETDKRPNLIAHEIDELMPLMRGDNPDHFFPFSFAANIQVPFDILQSLGVNIFRDLTFDTWVIQLVLRKLLLGVIPWDEHRRVADNVDDFDIKRHRDGLKDSLGGTVRNDHLPTFQTLYLFPALAMFNHSCKGSHNAEWEWHPNIRNRVVVWAVRSIQDGEEVVLRYTPNKFAKDAARRILGQPCWCGVCDDDGDDDDEDNIDDGDYYYDGLDYDHSDDDDEDDGDDDGDDHGSNDEDSDSDDSSGNNGGNWANYDSQAHYPNLNPEQQEQPSQTSSQVEITEEAANSLISLSQSALEYMNQSGVPLDGYAHPPIQPPPTTPPRQRNGTSSFSGNTDARSHITFSPPSGRMSHELSSSTHLHASGEWGEEGEEGREGEGEVGPKQNSASLSEGPVDESTPVPRGRRGDLFINGYEDGDGDEDLSEDGDVA